MQAAWYDPALRPQNLRSAEGEPVWVQHPGTWNLEAGPDFLGAVALVGTDRRRLEGDVEIHLRASGWTQHGHATDPRYRGVRLHVTYYPGTVPEGSLPSGAVQISLKSALDASPSFAFEAIDLTAYPYAARADVPPCSQILRGWSVEARQALLDAAGQERLRRKAVRLAARIEMQGAPQVLYEEVMVALGYKHNKAPFRELAQRVPVDVLRSVSGGDPEAAHAVLLGVAGLLPSRLPPSWDDAARRQARALWDLWWKRRERWADGCMTPAAWRLAGVRPANHPHRRLRAAASLFTAAPRIETQWASSRVDPKTVRTLSDALAALPAGAWARRFSLGGKAQRTGSALLGPDRIRALLANVWLPFVAAQPGAQIPPGSLDALPCEGSHQILRQTAHDLFGRDHTRALYHTALREQGLLQIFHDFCMNDRSRCAACALPGHLASFRAARGAER